MTNPNAEVNGSKSCTNEQSQSEMISTLSSSSESVSSTSELCQEEANCSPTETHENDYSKNNSKTRKIIRFSPYKRNENSQKPNTEALGAKAYHSPNKISEEETPPEEQTLAKAEKTHISHKITKKISCLVVEDNEVNQKIIRGFLEKLGFESDYASNGLEAANQAELKKYDVILMDIMMPVMDGLESTKRIRQTELNKESLIIAVTAMGQTEQYFKSKGMDDFLAKPFTRDKLCHILSKNNINVAVKK